MLYIYYGLLKMSIENKKYPLDLFIIQCNVFLSLNIFIVMSFYIVIDIDFLQILFLSLLIMTKYV